MKVIKKLHVKETYLLSLHVGDKVQASLEQFCKERDIRAASYTGIGAIKNVEVGSYDAKLKSYTSKTHNGEYELASFIGNIGVIKNPKEEKIFAHSHVTFIDRTRDVVTFGGHLFEADVYAVLEIFIQVYDTVFYRSKDSVTGLNILQEN